MENKSRRSRIFQPQAQSLVPPQYRQPIRDYISRTITRGNQELVDYVPNSHLRLWYNNEPTAFTEHHHDAAEIIYIKENLYPVTIGSEHFMLNTGDILYIPPYMPHTLDGGDGARFIMLLDLSPLRQFSDLGLNESALSRPQYMNEKHLPAYYSVVREGYEHIIEIYFKSDFMWELKVFASIFEIFAKIGTLTLSSSTNFHPDHGTTSLVNHEKFAALLTYIDQNYSEEITLEMAADRVGFSKYHFLRLFTEYTGSTFHEYLFRKRIQAAQVLLATDQSITDIAFATGFNSIGSFSRAFRKHTGMSPTEYREKKDKYDDKGHSKSSIIQT